jgi:hypothetical protein
MADDWKLERFYHTIVNAKDIDETVGFYQALGFEIVRDRRRMTWPRGGGVVFGMIPDTKGRRGTLMALPSDPPPDGPMLDIIQWLEPPRRSSIPRRARCRASWRSGPATCKRR